MGMFSIIMACGCSKPSNATSGWSDREMSKKPTKPKNINQLQSDTKLKLKSDVKTEHIDSEDLETLWQSYNDTKRDIESSSDEEEDMFILDPSIFKFETKCDCPKQTRPSFVPVLEFKKYMKK